MECLNADPLLECFAPMLDSRKYVLVATRGTGVCLLGATGVCRNSDHNHEAVIRYGYEVASEWALRMRRRGWDIHLMDRVDNERS